ncbi:MAG: hypothetical protein MZU91_08155 [Desulfosudis oleivorans]|nr:hypothetical protein [Desulfosudis oleivorans]
MQGYVQMVKEGKYHEALEIIMEDLPLPGVLGRICPHGCEDACRRAEKDEPVADPRPQAARRRPGGPAPRSRSPARRPGAETVAIVGSGPAGLSCGLSPGAQGHPVHHLRGAAVAPAACCGSGSRPTACRARCSTARSRSSPASGVEIKTGTALGRTSPSTDSSPRAIKAVYLAHGRPQGHRAGHSRAKSADGRAPGGGLPARGQPERARPGSAGGSPSSAAATWPSTWRARPCASGAEEVTIVYRRTRTEMPAWEEEIRARGGRGRQDHLSGRARRRSSRDDGRVAGLRCIRMELAEPDSSGRRRPVPGPGQRVRDRVRPDHPGHRAAAGPRRPWRRSTGLTFSRWGTLEADAVTYATGRRGRLCRRRSADRPLDGDRRRGRAARRRPNPSCATSDGRDMAEGREPAVTNDTRATARSPETNPGGRGRACPSCRWRSARAISGRWSSGYEETAGREEAGRCINCGYCCECCQCVDGLPRQGRRPRPGDRRSRDLQVGSVIVCHRAASPSIPPR